MSLTKRSYVDELLGDLRAMSAVATSYEIERDEARAEVEQLREALRELRDASERPGAGPVDP